MKHLPPFLTEARAACRRTATLRALARTLKVSEATASNYMSLLRKAGVRVPKFRAGRKAS